MSSKEEKQKIGLEELNITAPDDLGAGDELKTEEQEAIEAIRKFTDEDGDDIGELSVKSILGGDFLMSKFMVKQIMFVMFCVLLMILYTGNRYDSQQDTILIDSLRGRLQEVKYNVLTQSSELMNLTRQSNVEKSLRETPDSLLHNSITPPFLIKNHGGDTQMEENDFEEVLVDSQELAVQENEDSMDEQKKMETTGMENMEKSEKQKHGSDEQEVNKQASETQESQKTEKTDER